MRKLLSIISLTMLLAGCGTTKLLDTTDADAKINNADSRLIISRDESALYFASSAVVEANSQEIASLGRGGTVIHDVRAGRVTIAVHAYSSFGYYVIYLDTKPGKTYRFTISPRGKQMLLSPFSYAGDYVNGKIDDKTGYFQIVQAE